MRHLHLFQLFRNKLSIAGILLLSVTLVVGLPLLIVDLVFGHANPYAGILTHMIMPMGGLLGLFIALVGAFLNARNRRQHPELSPFSFPALDFNNPRQRQMDCIDCHNRPSHIFNPPQVAIDWAFQSNQLDPSLPYLKREGVRLLAAGTYKTEAEGREAIRKEISAFYKENYPTLFKEKVASLQQATKTLQDLFSVNLFPEMKTDWRSHPNHIGHLIWDGCFRCHDGLHQSKEGKVIANDCNACHTILAQGDPKKVSRGPLETQPFKHPLDMEIDLTQMKCTACHGVN